MVEVGELLQKRGLVSSEDLRLARAKANGGRIDQLLISSGLVNEDDVLQVIGEDLGMRFVELKDFVIDRELIAQFPTSAIFRYSLLPLERENGSVTVATSDPFDLESLDELSSLSGFKLRPVLARSDDVSELIKAHLGVGGDTITELVARSSEAQVELLEEISDEVGELAEEAHAASVIRLVNELLVEALSQRASDVHIEPTEGGLEVRVRVDGLLQLQPVPPEINQFYAAIVTRLKIMARLNIAEKRLPQDGRIKLRVSGREIDVRVSVIPMVYGEGIVLRLLDKDRMTFDLETVGMSSDIAPTFRSLISRPHGIILVTGPTGSGKTTTLYGALNEIKSVTRKIVTIEDPVEYQTRGVSQIQIHSKIGLTFAAGLRSILRHDPDVVLIGEIRDSETANAAIQASLTGHLVFSTLHTNDAPSAFTRLIDMGVEPYLVSSTLQGVLAQRLLRVLCNHCKEAYHPLTEELPRDFLEAEGHELYRPVGCRLCRGTGFAGRIGIFELLQTDDAVRRLCVDRADASQIREYGLKHGMTTLRKSGWRKVLAGESCIEEVLRITESDLV
jgi:general secretion pathway protein E/type IV pilus assembly protein PilB